MRKITHERTYMQSARFIKTLSKPTKPTRHLNINLRSYQLTGLITCMRVVTRQREGLGVSHYPGISIAKPQHHFDWRQ